MDALSEAELIVMRCIYLHYLLTVPPTWVEGA